MKAPKTAEVAREGEARHTRAFDASHGDRPKGNPLIVKIIADLAVLSIAPISSFRGAFVANVGRVLFAVKGVLRPHLV